MHTLLIADDDDFFRDYLTTKFSENSYLIDTAVDGADAYEHVKKQRPDIILMDTYMPKMLGYESCAAIRKLPYGQEIVIIGMSSNPEMEKDWMKLDCGVRKPDCADFFISKRDIIKSFPLLEEKIVCLLERK